MEKASAWSHDLTLSSGRERSEEVKCSCRHRLFMSSQTVHVVTERPVSRADVGVIKAKGNQKSSGRPTFILLVGRAHIIRPK